MKTLAINTASSTTGIAWLDGNNLIAEDSWAAKNDEAEKLLPAIKKLIGSFDEIERIIVVRGPGSFTGLRVGITVANTIAHLTKVPLYAISTFDYLHLHSDLPCVVFAGSKGVYLEEKLIPLDEFQTDIPQIFGDITDEQKSAINSEFIETTETFGQIISKFEPKEFVKIVEPLYIKEPNISTPKKKICFT